MITALRATSITLAKKIQNDLDSDPALGFKAFGMVVSLHTPKEMIDKSIEGVSVWLYRVVRDEETLNAPPIRLGFGIIKRDPLPMRLHYLITPIVDKKDPILGPEKEQFILGKILQIFHDCPKLRGADLQDDYSGTEVELSVRLETLNLEEITRIWEAVEGSYQLSVSYEVAIVNIESGVEPEKVAPVTVVMPDQGVIVSS